MGLLRGIGAAEVRATLSLQPCKMRSQSREHSKEEEEEEQVKFERLWAAERLSVVPYRNIAEWPGLRPSPKRATRNRSTCRGSSTTQKELYLHACIYRTPYLILSVVVAVALPYHNFPSPSSTLPKPPTPCTFCIGGACCCSARHSSLDTAVTQTGVKLVSHFSFLISRFPTLAIGLIMRLEWNVPACPPSLHALLCCLTESAYI